MKVSQTKVQSSLLCLMVIAVAGCASQQQPTAAAPDAAAKPAAPEAMTDAQRLAAAQAAGYTIVNDEGKTLYCRKEMQTGSHARYKKSCLTEREWEQMANSARETMRDVARRQPPPQGR